MHWQITMAGCQSLLRNAKINKTRRKEEKVNELRDVMSDHTETVVDQEGNVIKRTGSLGRVYYPDNSFGRELEVRTHKDGSVYVSIQNPDRDDDLWINLILEPAQARDLRDYLNTKLGD